MDYDPNRPIYLQVMQLIKQDIITGKRPPGDKLPGGRELASLYAINPNTAARVYQELEREGMCETRRGLGTFVTGDPERIRRAREEMAEEAVRRFLREMANLGVSREEARALIQRQEGTNDA
ncbi:MAG: GntR family transcriptional regulator [Clostridia bacterium]|nr:GntR family transcriptional regulator [Clostridia bacterium]